MLQAEDPLFTLNRTRLVELAAVGRLPAVYGTKEYADAGGLLSYGPDLVDLHRRAATYVDQILKGAKPGDLPVQQGPDASVLHRATIIEFARFSGLPTIFKWRDTVESGALVAYGPSIVDLYRRAAVYVDKVLRGARPTDLPVEQPVQFELAINLKPATALSLIPP